MPYTSELDITAATAGIDKFKAITEEAAITPVVLGNLLYQILKSMKPAAKAFGIPPNIPYAETLAVTHEPQKVKISYNYRNPAGNDLSMPVWINPATDKLAGVMTASDKNMLDICSVLAQSLDRGDDFRLVQDLTEWFENVKKTPYDIVQSLDVTTLGNAVRIDYRSNGVLCPDQEPDQMSLRIPPATPEAAGVMTAYDKKQLTKLSDAVFGKKQAADLDSLMDQGQYLLSDGSTLTVAVTVDKSFSITLKYTTITQVNVTQADIMVRSRKRIDNLQTQSVTWGDWSEWQSLKKVLDGWKELQDMKADVAYMKGVFDKNGW